jgi:hypothetical protein
LKRPLQIYQRVAQIAPEDPVPMEKLAQAPRTHLAILRKPIEALHAPPTFSSTSAMWIKPSRTGYASQRWTPNTCWHIHALRLHTTSRSQTAVCYRIYRRCQPHSANRQCPKDHRTRK